MVAGIYGMNFDVMPELRWSLGYPLALTGDVSWRAAPSTWASSALGGSDLSVLRETYLRTVSSRRMMRRTRRSGHGGISAWSTPIPPRKLQRVGIDPQEIEELQKMHVLDITRESIHAVSPDAGTWPTAPCGALSRQLLHGALRFLQEPCCFHGDRDMCGTSHVMASHCSHSRSVNRGEKRGEYARGPDQGARPPTGCASSQSAQRRHCRWGIGANWRDPAAARALRESTT